MKLSNINIILAYVICAVFVLTNCTHPTQNAGNGSGVGNGTVAGILYEPDGKTPADNAVVQFIPSKNIPSPQLEKSQAAIYSTTTNSKGQYFADSIPAGYYNISGSKGEYLCYAESVIVNDSTPLPNDTLKAPGSLKGIIRLEPWHDSRHVLILIFGSNSFASPNDSIGNFSLTDMAEGNYHVRLLATGGGYNYLPLDTVFSIVSGENRTLRDTIFLRLDSLDAPEVVNAKALEYGSVLVSWRKINEAIVYSIYRSETDTGTYSYIGHTIDTFYNDGVNLDNGRIYFYKIQATNSMAVSPYSSPCSALTTPAMPESVLVVALADSQIRVSWHSVRSATKYRAFVQKNNGGYDSTAFVNDTVDTIKGVDYRDPNSYMVKAYNPSGESPISQGATIPLGTILVTNPFFADSGVVYKEPLTSLYDSSNNRIGVDSSTTIMIQANNKIDYLLVIGDSNEYVAGSMIYSYSQLITEINRFLQDSIDSHIKVTRNPDNSIQIVNPTSSSSQLDFYLFNILNMSLAGGIGIGDSIRSEKVIIRNLRPARATDLIANLYDARGYVISNSTTGLETGDHISIDGALDGSTIPSKTLIYSQKMTTLQDLCDSIRSAFSLPLYDGTPENNLSVSVNNFPGAIPLGAIVIRGRPGYAFQIQNASISTDNSNNNSVSPGLFNGNMSLTNIRWARD